MSKISSIIRSAVLAGTVVLLLFSGYWKSFVPFLAVFHKYGKYAVNYFVFRSADKRGALKIYTQACDTK